MIFGRSANSSGEERAGSEVAAGDGATAAAVRLSDVVGSTVRDVVVVEVGPRDGLQNEAGQIPTTAKIAFVNALSDADLPVVEVTSFVNPRLVPQLADAAEVMSGIQRISGIRYPVLVPNDRGLSRALEVGVDAIALFAAATEEFSAANVGASITESFERFAPVVTRAKEQHLWIRGYVSVAFGCPYEGTVNHAAVAHVVARLVALGCDEICLADTIGVATPDTVRITLEAVQQAVPTNRLALHFHDTSGTALNNVEAALAHGIRIFDAAAGGLGGCPFAPGAPGNLATEALVGRLEHLGFRTGVKVDQIQHAVSLVRPYVSKRGVFSA